MSAPLEAMPGRASQGTSVRVLLADDSAVVRGLTRKWLDAAGGIEILGSATNGLQAVAMAASLKPDVVVLDIEMPEMDGLTALPQILRAAPGVKVLMSSTLTVRNGEASIRAMSLGAADYVPKPEAFRGEDTVEQFRAELVRKVLGLGQARALARPHAPSMAAKAAAPVAPPPPRRLTLRTPSPLKPAILAIGSSTGGPQALFQFLRGVAPFLDVPVVITQHMPPTFTALLAEHIGKLSGLAAAEAKSGDVLQPRQVLVAPGDRHMVFKARGRDVFVELLDTPPENFCRPAVDPMFRSIADVYGAGALCVVLTGMGADGREGGKRVVAAGGTILAQDAETSVVWGMPGAVAEAGLCAAVQPLLSLPGEVQKLMTRGRK